MTYKLQSWLCFKEQAKQYSMKYQNNTFICIFWQRFQEITVPIQTVHFDDFWDFTPL